MSLSMYQASIPPFIRLLNHLSNILDKAAAHAEAKKFDPSVLVQARLAPDMFPLARQVQITTDGVKGFAARMADVENPVFEDTESTLPELKERVAKTIKFLESFKPEQIDGTEAKEISITMRGKTTNYIGQPYLLTYVIPNFYFHLTTTYAILRHNGVDIGKRDFLGTFN